MPDTTFAPGSTIRSDWLNEVNDAIFNNTNPTGNPSGAANLRSQLATTGTGLGAELVAYIAKGAGAVATTVDSALDWMPNSVFRYMTPAQVAACQARTIAVDMTAAIQAAHDAHDDVYWPPGAYRISSPIVVNRAARVLGANVVSTDLYCYACSAFLVDATNASGITIEGMTIRLRTGAGVPDPKNFDGVVSPGAPGLTVNYMTLRNLFFQGWDRCIDWRYTWNSVVENCTTLNCNNSIRLFGQSVNNSIANSRLGANTGTVSVDLVADGSTIGEGLNIANSLLAEGQFGVRSNNGWLSLNLANTIIDLVTDVGLKLVDARKTSVASSWIFATNKGVECAALGASVESDVDLSGVHIITTSATGRGVDFGANNSGLTISGGSITVAANGNCVYADGSGVSVVGVRLVNPGSSVSIFFGNGVDYHESGNTGNTSVTYNAGVPSAFRGRMITYRTGLAYSASMTPDVSRGNYFNVVVTNNSPFTFNAPTNAPSDPQSQEIKITVANASGGALGAVTWNAIYKLAAWTSPATGFGRSITFQWNGTNWIEQSRTAADVPN